MAGAVVVALESKPLPEGTVELERVPCNLCGSSAADVVWSQLTDPVSGVPQSFALVRCQSCRLMYVSPRPTRRSIDFYYPDDYYPDSSPSHVPGHPRPRTGLRETAEFIAFWPFRRRHRQAPRWRIPFGTRRCLDVGCGQGRLLAELKESGWDVHGIDPSRRAVALATERLGTGVVVEGTLETVVWPEGWFDLVILWHSLEHMHDPAGNLGTVHRLLKADGRLVLAVPNIDSWEAQLFGSSWMNLDVPRHLYHFSSRTLSQLLESVGFRIVNTLPQPMPASISGSIANLLRKHRIALPRLLGRIVHASILPIAACVYFWGNGGNVEVLATKGSYVSVRR